MSPAEARVIRAVRANIRALSRWLELQAGVVFPPHGQYDIHPWDHGAETGVETIAEDQTREGPESPTSQDPTGHAQGAGSGKGTTLSYQPGSEATSFCHADQGCAQRSTDAVAMDAHS